MTNNAESTISSIIMEKKIWVKREFHFQLGGLIHAALVFFQLFFVSNVGCEPY